MCANPFQFSWLLFPSLTSGSQQPPSARPASRGLLGSGISHGRAPHGLPSFLGEWVGDTSACSLAASLVWGGLCSSHCVECSPIFNRISFVSVAVRMV